jgi:hypothetical protein
MGGGRGSYASPRSTLKTPHPSGERKWPKPPGGRLADENTSGPTMTPAGRVSSVQVWKFAAGLPFDRPWS